jgi:hypothetical protein
MSQIKCLTVMATAAILVTAAACSRPAPEAAPGAAVSPAATPAQTGAPAGAQPPAAAPAAKPAGAGSPAAARQPAATAEAAKAPVAPPPEPPKPRTFTLEAGTVIKVQTTSSLSTKTNKTGEPFAATLVAPIVDGDWVIAPKGATVSGVIVESDEGGRVKGVASMAIAMKQLALSDGQTVAIATSTYGVEAKSSVKKDVAKVAVGAGAGAVIGGIAGGGKGAAIGAAVGGGAGTAGALATRGDPAVIPAGTVVSVKLTAPTTVTKKQ